MSSSPTSSSHRFTAFAGDRLIVSGDIATVARGAKEAVDASPDAAVLVFDDDSGAVVDLDLRGSHAQVQARLRARFGSEPHRDGDETEAGAEGVALRGRGRPRLGVVAREVTLLPRHWEWLAAQPGSASVVLRRLIDEARARHAERDRRRAAQKAAYLFASAMAGDRPNYEEAIRALFAGDRDRFRMLVADWPPDVRGHVQRLASHAFGAAGEGRLDSDS